MPSVTFVLPHWLYWAGLLVFPAVAMFLSRRIQPEPGSRSNGIAYFIWAVGGFLGLHRIYLKNIWGLLYWPLFALILFSSSMERDARVIYSDAKAAVQAIEASITRTERRIDKADRAVEKARETLAALPADDKSARDRQLRKIDKETKRRDEAVAKIASLKEEEAGLGPQIEAAQANREKWASTSFYAFLAIVAFLALDLIMIPSMTRRALEKLAKNPDDPVDREFLADDRIRAGQGVGGMIDRLSLFTGEFVAFWSVIAVFVYYYEVIVRYVFNSPTNWAHESMFLMFGMQYLIAGAYAMLTESHVRVDILYANYSDRGKALVDLLTSVFFFIFAGTLLVTGWIFAADSIGQGEVSFTEWAIQYWPVKCVIVLGAVLILLQGCSKVAKDFMTVIAPHGGARHGA